uniref:sialidase family protein n=1 Tax=Proteiniclasticum sp. TaxID=2053595 RepID=UPI00289A6313
MNYITLPGLTSDGKLYFNEDMGTVEAKIPAGTYLTCHSPAMLELPNGDLLCCWFAGSYEGEPDVSIVCARLPVGADRWSEPVLVSGDPERSEQNPSLFLGPDGAVWCMYTAQLARENGKDNMQFTSQIRCQKSFDGGLTWEAYETVFPREGSFCRQPIQVLENGRWIFG